MKNKSEVEMEVMKEVVDWRYTRTFETRHRIVDVFSELCKDVHNIPINVISEDEMRKHGLEMGHAKAEAKRWQEA